MIFPRLKGLLAFALLFALISLLPLLLLPHLPLTIIENDRPATLLTLLFALLAILFAFWVALPTFSLSLFFALALLSGGALSNLSYRLLLGPVPDYIPLPNNYFANLADLFILFGGLLFSFLLLRAALPLNKKRESGSSS